MSERTKDVAVLSSRAASGAAWMLLEMSGLQGMSLIFFMLLAHVLTPHDFGLISICFVAMMSVRILIQDRIPEAIAVRASSTSEDWTSAFWLSATTGLVMAALLYCAAGTVQSVIGAPGLAPVLRAMSVIVFSCGLARTHEVRLTRGFQFRALASRGMAGCLAGGRVGVLVAIDGGGVWALVAQQVVGNFVSLALLWAVSDWRPSRHPSAAAARAIMAYVRDVAGNGVVGVLNQSCDTFLVATTFGVTTAGYYNVAKRLRLALALVASAPITSVITPAIAESLKDPRLTREFVGQALRTISFLGSPIFLGAVLVSNESIVVLFGPRWAAAGPIFAALSVAGILQSFQSFTNAIFVTHSRPRWMVYFSILETCLAIAAFTVIAPLLGPKGVGLAFALPLAVSVPLGAILAMRLIGLTMRDWWRLISPGVTAALLMLACVELIRPLLAGFPAAERGGIVIVCGLAVFPPILLLIDRPAFRVAIGLARSRSFRPKRARLA